MAAKGIDHILISVRDMKESLAFYRDFIRMTVVADELLDAEEIQHLWGLPKGTTARAVYLRNEDQPTLLELIEFSPRSSRFIRTGARVYDYGLYDVAFRAKNIDAAYETLKNKGYRFISPPATYTADWAKVTVKEVILIGPNEMPIAFIERMSEPKVVFKGDFGTMVDSAQFVGNIEQVSEFYVEVLGLNNVFDQTLPKGLIDEVLALPPGTESRMAFLLAMGTNTPAVELIQCSVKGKYLAARPPDIGIFATGWNVEDLSKGIEKLRGHGYRILSGPVECHAGPHEKVRAITIEGPNKVMLEFFEK